MKNSIDSMKTGLTENRQMNTSNNMVCNVKKKDVEFNLRPLIYYKKLSLS